MISENIDRLITKDNQVIFINAAGTSIEMSNLTALVNEYKINIKIRDGFTFLKNVNPSFIFKLI